jgi:NAD(P)-dependent dehydrogenase (short-subunit alcohol dehydrogenase family)
VDVVDLTQVQDLANFALEKFQRLDIWINNAGLPGPYGPTVHTPVDRFIEVSRTNIFGTYNGSLVAMRHFLGIGGGKLINILGRGARGPQPMQNAYASSKAWILRFTQALAEEYKGSGVGVYAFSPGMMDTEMLLDVEFIEGYEQRAKVLPTVMRFLSQPVEVPARKAVWLASASTDGKTGLVVHELTMRKMVIHALGIGLNRLFHRPGRTYDLKIRTIPAAYPPINHLG